jgi:hypothetical protein
MVLLNSHPLIGNEMTRITITHKHPTRGYRAEVVAETPDLVLYNSWDEDGAPIQHNGSRKPADFARDWVRVIS